MRTLRLFALVALLSLPSLAQSAAQGSYIPVIQTPAYAATARGLLRLAIQVPDQAPFRSIEYWVNNRLISPRLSDPPFAFDWPTGLLWDGIATVFAVARDANGLELGRSRPVGFRIANGPASVTLRSPAAGATLSGTLPWTVDATHPDGIEAVTFVLDGEFADKYTNSIPLDTTKLSNGLHELFTGVYAKNGAQPVGMTHTLVNVDNGHLLRELRPNWRTVYLTPSSTAALTAAAIYTDSAQEPVTNGLAFASSDPAIATVDASGLITAVAPGLATITTTWRQFIARTRVDVRASLALAHFAKDGQILTAYDPARSLFVRTLFGLSSDELAANPALGPQIQQAAINALSEGFYTNPGDTGARDFDSWRQGWLANWDRKSRTAAALGLSFYLIGDDVARTPKELHNSITNAWSEDALLYALSTLRNSKQVIAIDMVDEVNFLWGDNPQPSDGRWTKFNPSIPDSAFVKLMSIVNRVPGRPPISWPVAGLAGTTEVSHWLGDSTLSDFTSHYWTNLDWRWAYPTTGSLPQFRRNIDLAVVNRAPYIQRDKPQIMLASMAGPFYTKLVSGGQYAPLADKLQQPGVSPAAVASQIMYAAAMGQAGVRVYHFDFRQWKSERANAPLGNGDLQTGAEPFDVGADRWAAMASAFNLVKRLEPYLLQPLMHSPELGASFVTGARQGPHSRLLLIVNMSELTHSAEVNLDPYRYPEANTIALLRLASPRTRSETLANGKSLRLTMEPGESVALVFTPDDPLNWQKSLQKTKSSVGPQ